MATGTGKTDQSPSLQPRTYIAGTVFLVTGVALLALAAGFHHRDFLSTQMLMTTAPAVGALGAGGTYLLLDRSQSGILRKICKVAAPLIFMAAATAGITASQVVHGTAPFMHQGWLAPSVFMPLLGIGSLWYSYRNWEERGEDQRKGVTPSHSPSPLERPQAQPKQATSEEVIQRMHEWYAKPGEVTTIDSGREIFTLSYCREYFNKGAENGDDSRWKGQVYHHIIQWLFPSSTPSGYNRNAPLLSHHDFKQLPKQEIRRNFEAMLNYYGLKEEEGKIVLGGQKWGQKALLEGKGNHNYLRITRILNCLMQVGLEKEARAFHIFLQAYFTSGAGVSVKSSRALNFWERVTTRSSS